MELAILVAEVLKMDLIKPLLNKYLKQGFHIQKLRCVTKNLCELCGGARKKYQTVTKICVILPETQ